jgi:EF hand
MRRQVLVIGISFAVVALSGVPHEAAAQTQQATQAGQTQQIQPEGGMMGGGMMGGDPMHGGMRGQQRGPIGTGMMRMMFSLMDADGDGSISLQEFQAAHERIFKGMDQNKDGRLTMEEMQSFMGGGTGR